MRGTNGLSPVEVLDAPVPYNRDVVPAVRGAPRRRAAQALVELAFVLPVFLLLVLGGLDLGRAFVYGIAVQSGAGAAVRFGSMQYSSPSLGITSTTIYQRLIDASSPALSDCAAGSGASMTCTDATGASWTLSITYAPSQAAGNSIEVKAVGDVGLFTGISTSLARLPTIGVQGDAKGVLL